MILKSIAAFSNGEGGTLLIGVNDEGEILGLENDYTILEWPASMRQEHRWQWI